MFGLILNVVLFGVNIYMADMKYKQQEYRSCAISAFAGGVSFMGAIACIFNLV